MTAFAASPPPCLGSGCDIFRHAVEFDACASYHSQYQLELKLYPRRLIFRPPTLSRVDPGATWSGNPEVRLYWIRLGHATERTNGR
eukprot:gene20470-biopygen6746